MTCSLQNAQVPSNLPLSRVHSAQDPLLHFSAIQPHCLKAQLEQGWLWGAPPPSPSVCAQPTAALGTLPIGIFRSGSLGRPHTQHSV